MWRAAGKPACPQTSLGTPAAESKGKGRGRRGGGQEAGSWILSVALSLHSRVALGETPPPSGHQLPLLEQWWVRG